MSKDIRCASGSTSTPWAAGWAPTAARIRPSDIQRGMFAGEVGMPRLLQLFERTDMPATGSARATRSRRSREQIERWSRRARDRRARLLAREPDRHDARTQESDVLEHCVELIEKRSGRKPRGLRRAVVGDVARSPTSCCSRTVSATTTARCYNDFTPFYARVGDTWTKIDYYASPPTSG